MGALNPGPPHPLSPLAEHNRPHDVHIYATDIQRKSLNIPSLTCVWLQLVPVCSLENNDQSVSRRWQQQPAWRLCSGISPLRLVPGWQRSCAAASARLAHPTPAMPSAQTVQHSPSEGNPPAEPFSSSSTGGWGDWGTCLISTVPVVADCFQCHTNVEAPCENSDFVWITHVNRLLSLMTNS